MWSRGASSPSCDCFDFPVEGDGATIRRQLGNAVPLELGKAVVGAVAEQLGVLSRPGCSPHRRSLSRDRLMGLTIDKKRARRQLGGALQLARSDAVHFVRSVAAAGFPHAMIAGLESVDAEVLRLSKEAWHETGVYVTVYTQFSDILLDALAWSRRPLNQLLAEFPRDVVDRLTQLEVKTGSMALWGELVS